jgi:ATP-dependent exoDNAse (exonuclease V) beta subunit
MSVHAAKGLEFPVVVMGDITYGGGRGGGSVLIDPDLGVLLPHKDDEGMRSASYRLGALRSDDQEGAESDRLLYVAATRAREKLILSGCISLTKAGTPGRSSGWLGRLDGPLGLSDAGIGHDDEGSSAIHLDLGVGNTPVACTIYEPGWKWVSPVPETKLETEGKLSPPPQLLTSVSAGQEQTDRRTSEQDRIPMQRVWRVVPTAEGSRAPAWVIGSLVHEALASWRFPNGGRPTPTLGHSFERWAQARARAYGLTDRRQLDDATRRCRQLLLRFKAHSLYQEMDTADRRLYEVPYSLMVDGCVENGIIDALYLRDDMWTIVEFKTDRVADRVQFEALLAAEDYAAQTRRYVAAAERLLGQRPRCILCMLNYAGGVHLETDPNRF